MKSAEPLFRLGRTLLLVAMAALITACGGGTTSSSTTICRDPSVCNTPLAHQDTPTGPNTTEIIVDRGPALFGLGVTNVPYVTVTVCSPGATNGSTVDCVTIDHVVLDTGSYGLRVLKSKVDGLDHGQGLPAVTVAADLGTNTPAGVAAECYPFVIGTIWGLLAKADVRIAEELAAAQTIQLIDDSQSPSHLVPVDCTDLAGSSGLLNSVSMLQANGILGVGKASIDCGIPCETNAPIEMHYVYYSCPPAGAPCVPAGLPSASQVQNPVVSFAVNNNGTMISMPALPKLGATVATGRLVFGIGTQTNNQLPPPLIAGMYPVVIDPTSLDYLYLDMKIGARSYPKSDIDSGSNATFFDSTDPALSRLCGTATGSVGNWYCPVDTWRQTVTLTNVLGDPGTFELAIDNADALFSVGATALSNLGGTAGQGAQTFLLGMPFFYGRQVFTSIWHQRLSESGPWYAF